MHISADIAAAAERIVSYCDEFVMSTVNRRCEGEGEGTNEEGEREVGGNEDKSKEKNENERESYSPNVNGHVSERNVCVDARYVSCLLWKINIFFFHIFLNSFIFIVQ